MPQSGQGRVRKVVWGSGAEVQKSLSHQCKRLVSALPHQNPKSPFALSPNQKKRDVHKISACNSGAGNGCADFMGAWRFFGSFCWKTPCHGGGGWKCQFYFYGRGDFSDLTTLLWFGRFDPSLCPLWSQSRLSFATGLMYLGDSF